LSIAAARSSASPQVPIAALVAALRDARQQLNALSTGEAASDLRTLFRSSYRHLSAPARRLFRRLGPYPGPDISLPAAASLAGISPLRARRALDELCTANLLTERAPYRYVLHDLLRTYASELAEQHDDDAEQHAATDRLFNHYLNSLQAVDRVRYPQDRPILSSAPLPGVWPEEFTDPGEALAWCQNERGVLTAMLGQVAEAAPDEYLTVPRWGLWLYFHLWGHRHDLAEARRVVLTATRSAGGDPTEAPEEPRSGDARYRYRQLVQLGREGGGEQTARAYCLFGLIQILNRQGRHGVARGFAQRALEWFRATGDQAGTALALNQIGRLHIVLGRPEEAVTMCRQAMDLCRELGDRMGEAWAADGLGLARHRLGDFAQAARWCEHAAALYARLGDQDAQLETLLHLGDARQALGQTGAARQSWRDALALLSDPEHPNAAPLRVRLSDG
jgi:tetratricopeptide (TPR) repeat protein